MKTVLLSSVLAAGTALLPSVSTAAPSSLWPTREDKAICDPILSRMAQQDRGTLIAQAETDQPKKDGNDKSDKPDEDKLATELTAMLQACSYDGKALKVDPTAFGSGGGMEGRQAVGAIMRYTGLPQNFRVMESDVPNAAAMIVMGPDGVPQRVIAYNKAFMQQVAEATDGGDWPAISILAHEIGHHLSGHTLVPGGSQPPIELEADKFSGFVLFKMGATLPQAEQAIATLIPEADGPTHPGRKKRLAAIESGWIDSCSQQGDDCTATTEVAKVETPPAAVAQAETRTPKAQSQQQAALQAADGETPQMPEIPGPFDGMPPLDPNGSANVIGPAVIDKLPVLSADATPSKFDRFVYDDFGAFDPEVREKLQTIAYQFAAAANVEVVTVVAKDLQGRDPDQYAMDFMRQMRVGKLDVGNGAVLVVHPETRQVGLALGPGLRLVFENDDSPKRRLQSFVDQISDRVPAQKISWTLASAAYRVMSQAKPLEWVVRYPTFEAYSTAKTKNSEERAKGTTPFDPAKDPVFQKLLRLEATVVTKSPDMNDRKLMVNEPRSRHVGPAMQVRTPDGRDVVLYVNASVPGLMPVPLEEGKRYAFIARDTILMTGAPQLDLISYDLLD